MKVQPLCPYFGPCGGCGYQDVSYEEELRIKERNLKELFKEKLVLPDADFLPVLPSSSPDFYRSRLDLTFRRSRGALRLGFNSEGIGALIPIDACSIARPEINRFLPELKRLAAERMPAEYQNANLVIKTDDSGKIRWGGIGRGSLKLEETDYLWTEIEGKRIHFSLESFFQANLAILPSLMPVLRSFLELDERTHFLDLYAGVGLFWGVLAPEAAATWAVEESGSSLRVAEFNRCYLRYSNVYLKAGRTEDILEEVLEESRGRRQAALVDPPRQGLTPAALEKFLKAKTLNPLVYISCNPEALVRDLIEFQNAGWKIDRIAPCDFFPRTRHLEVIARLHFEG